MSTTLNTIEYNLRFYDSTIGKKVIMAVTGVVLFGFIIGHLLGNLQIYLPADAEGIYKLDTYAKFLHGNPGLLWGARVVLLISVLLHIWSSISLAQGQRKARPIAYRKKDNAHSSYASRTMQLSGPIVALFILYHLLHFTGGQAHPHFSESVRQNVVVGFQDWPASLAYICAITLLGLHLNHGLWSLFQTLGVSHPRYTPLLKGFAIALSFFVVAGNISIPAAVLLGLLK